MSRYRLLPSPAQEAVLRNHCAHARYFWNLAVEQHAHWRPGRKSGPGYLEQCRAAHRRTRGAPMAGHRISDGAATGVARLRHCDGRLLRSAEPGRGAVVAQSLPGRRISCRRPTRAALGCTPPVPSRRRGPCAEGGVGAIALVPCCTVRSEVLHRVTCDCAGRWHVAFVSIPNPISAPGNTEVVGIDRGVVVSAASVDWRVAERSRSQRLGAEEAAAPGTQACRCPARL